MSNPPCLPPPHVPLQLDHPIAHELRWQREKLELPRTDAQELVVFLPADDGTTRAMERLRRQPDRILHAIT